MRVGLVAALAMRRLLAMLERTRDFIATSRADLRVLRPSRSVWFSNGATTMGEVLGRFCVRLEVGARPGYCSA